jgi:MFS superfamily sulfate permease-like transporter
MAALHSLSVIGGFLAASGILLVTGGMEVVTQTNLTLAPRAGRSSIRRL